MDPHMCLVSFMCQNLFLIWSPASPIIAPTIPTITILLFHSALHPPAMFNPLPKWVLAVYGHIIGRCKRRRRRSLVNGGFDWLSLSVAAMEISSQLKQVFRLIDVDGDGKISSEELEEVLLCLGCDKSLAAKEAEGMVREVDCNGDGVIDMDEFMDVVMGSRRGGAEDDLMEAFRMFDKDQNGFISAKELRRVLRSLGYEKCSLEECYLMIRGVDKNGDGMVDFEEFVSMMTAHRS